MHIPDGFIDAPTSLAFGAVAVAGVTVAAHHARRELDDRLVPMAGLTAAFVFAVQMLNFPVAAGTSGHLLGGVLAAVLVGPWTGALCVSVVLLVQALFADGGLTALGLNITDIALVTVVVGWGAFRLLVRLLPKTEAAVPLAAGIAAGLSVPASAGAFVLQYAVGGADAVPLATLAGAMLGVHVLIGIGEGIITAVTVGAVLTARPDLVRGAAHLVRPLQLRSAPAPRQGATDRPVVATEDAR